MKSHEAFALSRRSQRMKNILPSMLSFIKGAAERGESSVYFPMEGADREDLQCLEDLGYRCTIHYHDYKTNDCPAKGITIDWEPPF